MEPRPASDRRRATSASSSCSTAPRSCSPSAATPRPGSSTSCGAAGVAKGLFYWYFENKEALFKELVEQHPAATCAGSRAQRIDPDAPTRSCNLYQGTEASVRVHGRARPLLLAARGGGPRSSSPTCSARAPQQHIDDMVRDRRGRAGRRHDPRRGPDCSSPSAWSDRWATTRHFHRTGRIALPLAELAAVRRPATSCTRWPPTSDDRPAGPGGRPRGHRPPEPEPGVGPRRAMSSPPEGSRSASRPEHRAGGNRRGASTLPVRRVDRAAKEDPRGVRRQGSRTGPRRPHEPVVTDVPFGRRHRSTPTWTPPAASSRWRRATSTTPTSRSRSTTSPPRRSSSSGNPQAGMQAFMAGKIKVQGDMTKLMAMQQGAPDPDRRARSPPRSRRSPTSVATRRCAVAAMPSEVGRLGGRRRRSRRTLGRATSAAAAPSRSRRRHSSSVARRRHGEAPFGALGVDRTKVADTSPTRASTAPTR